MKRRHPPKIFKRSNSSALWIRYYDANGKLRRVSSNTNDPATAQRVLEQHLEKVDDHHGQDWRQLALRDGFFWFERSDELDPEDLVRFRHLLPFLLDALEAHDVTTFEELGRVQMHRLIEWLDEVTVSGASTEQEGGQPFYEGPFRLTSEGKYEAFVFAGQALEAVSMLRQ